MKELKSNLDKSEIMESWKWDIDELKEQMNEIRRRIRLAEKERKMQPHLILKSELGGQYYVTNRYRIIEKKNGSVVILAESKRQATENEVKEIQ